MSRLDDLEDEVELLESGKASNAAMVFACFATAIIVLSIIGIVNLVSAPPYIPPIYHSTYTILNQTFNLSFTRGLFDSCYILTVNTSYSEGLQVIQILKGNLAGNESFYWSPERCGHLSN